jgi:hypothetical protein
MLKIVSLASRVSEPCWFRFFLERPYVRLQGESIWLPHIRINKFPQDFGFRRKKLHNIFWDHRRVKEVRKRSARAATDRLVWWSRESDE